MYIQDVREQALKYLGYDNQILDAQTHQLLETCLEEITIKATPHFITQTYPLYHQPLRIGEVEIPLPYEELEALFSGCEEVCIIGATLGLGVERYCALLSKIDMAKLVVFDAVASAYLEVQCDAYEDKLGLGTRTFRYCPGYGSVPIELNRTLCRTLQMEKHIGLTVQPSHLLLPQKSMIGLIGMGETRKEKSCQGCLKYETCNLRKKEMPCYRVN